MAVRGRVSGRGPRRRNGVPDNLRLVGWRNGVPDNLRLVGWRRRGKDSPEGAYRTAGPRTKDEKARGMLKSPRTKD